MKPPHWLCLYCGIIIQGQGHKPDRCSYCEHTEFIDLGYEGEYDQIKVRAMNKIFFRPERFTPDSQMLYWKAFTPEGKKTHEAAINELNANIRELIDVGEISLSNDELEKKLNE